jgi:branched-chain amino acid transport system substrate-binding protein
MRLKKAAPDVLSHVSYFNDQVLFTRQARELDFNVKAFLTCGPQGDPAMMGILKSDINYLCNAFRYCGEFYDGEYTVNLKPFRPEAVKTLKEFFKRYAKRYNVTMGEIPPTALLGFNGAWILFKYVLPKAGSDKPEAVRKAALSLDEPYGTTPIGMGIKFAPPGHPHAGLNLNFTAGIFQWQDQKFYCVWPKEYRSRKPMLPVPSWKDR